MEYDRISDLRDPARRDHGGGAGDLGGAVMQFILGFFLGTTVGILLMAIVTAGRDDR